MVGLVFQVISNGITLEKKLYVICCLSFVGGVDMGHG
jgi:hypothetical protein